MNGLYNVKGERGLRVYSCCKFWFVCEATFFSQGWANMIGLHIKLPICLPSG